MDQDLLELQQQAEGEERAVPPQLDDHNYNRPALQHLLHRGQRVMSLNARLLVWQAARRGPGAQNNRNMNGRRAHRAGGNHRRLWPRKALVFQQRQQLREARGVQHQINLDIRRGLNEPNNNGNLQQPHQVNGPRVNVAGVEAREVPRGPEPENNQLHPKEGQRNAEDDEFEGCRALLRWLERKIDEDNLQQQLDQGPRVNMAEGSEPENNEEQRNAGGARRRSSSGRVQGADHHGSDDMNQGPRRNLDGDENL